MGPFRRSSQGMEQHESLGDLQYTTSPKAHPRHSARRVIGNLNSESSPLDKMVILSEIKDQQRRMLNKSNVKASLLDLINEQSIANLHDQSKLSGASPKTNRRLGYAGAGVTEVDKRLLAARTSLQSLLQRSQDRGSQEDLDDRETEPMTSFVQSNTNILENTLIPDKDAEISKDVQKQGGSHVSATFRSTLMPYSFNITQRNGNYQTLPA